MNTLLTVLLVLSGYMGQLLTTQKFYSPLWIPGGVALAAILVFGIKQVIAGLGLGFFLMACQLKLPTITTLGIFLTNFFEPILSSIILTYSGHGVFRFKTMKDVFIFVTLGVALVPFTSTSVILAFFLNNEVVVLNKLPEVWGVFLASHVLGILIFTPLILSFFQKTEKRANKIEGSILYSSLVVVATWAFSGHGPRSFAVLPFLVWAALRFGFRGISISTIILGIIVCTSSFYYSGVFDASPEKDLFWIQCLVGGATLVGYFLATAIEAHERAEANALESYINLEHKKIAEEALAILDQSLNKSPIGFALIDRNFRYIRINEMMSRYNGASSDYHLGKTLREMLSSRNVDEIESKVKFVFKTGQSVLNLPFQKSSLEKPMEVMSGFQSYYPIRHPITDEIFGVAITFQDMTEQIHSQVLLEENQARMNFAQEVGKIGAFEWDVVTNKIIWTPEMDAIYGINPGEFGGLLESWLKCVHPEDVERVREAFTKALEQENELNFQFRIITKNNDIHWILARGKKMKKGASEKLIGINIDVTEQKHSEQKLRVTEANLLHALSVRDEFMAIASHELKTPLTSLKLQTELFQRNMARPDGAQFSQEKIQQLLERNSNQIDRLTRLVDDMLDISRIRTGKLTLKPETCDLNKMLKDIIFRTKEQFVASGSGEPLIENFDEAFGEWDPLRIEQVITNIITNAIRYGKGQPISIAVKNFQDTVRLSVKDQGLGIPKSDQKKIFQRYERGLLAREVRGLGLGLFITQQIVEAHNGKIWVESEVNQGATFFVELPRNTVSRFWDLKIQPLFSTNN